MVSKCVIDTAHCTINCPWLSLTLFPRRSGFPDVPMFRMCDGQNPEFELRHFRHENTRNNRRKKQTPQPRHFEILTVKGPWDCWTHIVGLWDCSNDSVGLEVLLGEVKFRLGEVTDEYELSYNCSNFWEINWKL